MSRPTNDLPMKVQSDKILQGTGRHQDEGSRHDADKIFSTCPAALVQKCVHGLMRARVAWDGT